MKCKNKRKKYFIRKKRKKKTNLSRIKKGEEKRNATKINENVKLETC